MKITQKLLKEMIKDVVHNKKDKLLHYPGNVLVREGNRTYSMQKLNETTMTAVQGKYMQSGFIVLTSDRSCQAEMGIPYGEPCPDDKVDFYEQNNIENREILKKWVRSAGFGFTPVYGGYREEIKDEEGNVVGHVDDDNPEHSLLIMAREGTKGKDHIALKSFGMQVADAFNQDSFFYKPPNSQDTNAYFVRRDGSIADTFSDFVFGDLKQTYFTQLARGKQKHQLHKRFSAIPECLYVPKPPLTAIEARERRGEIFIKVIK